MTEDLIQAIREKYDSLTLAEKRVADYLLSNPTALAFLTASRLAREAGVSESTAVRFCTHLGFSGYLHLRKSVQEDLLEDRTLTKLKESTLQSEPDANLFSRIMQTEAENILLSIKETNIEDLERAVQIICTAKRVFVFGMRASAAIASYLAFSLQMILSQVTAISGSQAWVEQLARVSSGDCLIAIGFKRYSAETVSAIKHCHQCGAETISITDFGSPLSQYSSVTFKIRTKSHSFLDSYTAAISLINALVTYIARTKKDEVAERLKVIERLYKENAVFYRRGGSYRCE